MPAIQPARLKVQAAQLAGSFTNPLAYVRGLHNLLDFYADRTYRPGQTGAPPALLKSYNVPLPVLRQVRLELIPLINANPQAALALCDALWAEPAFEFRQLAAYLLGQVPLTPPELIIARLHDWLRMAPEERLVDALLTQGIARLHTETPDYFLKLIEEWMTTPETIARQLGLRAQLVLIQDPGFENLPYLYRLLTPLLRIAPQPLRPDLLRVLRVLAHRSPQEISFLLKQQLSAAESFDTAWIIRQVTPAFPPEMRASLRDVSHPSTS